MTDPKGLNTTYGYNGFGDLTQLVSPDTGTTTYTYGDGGNRRTQTDARNVSQTYTYDALNRLVSITYPNIAFNTTYSYDTTEQGCLAGETFAVGRLSKMTDGSGTTKYCYDRFGNIVRKIQTNKTKVFTSTYTYDLARRVGSVTYPDGTRIDYPRDTQGRVRNIYVTLPNGAFKGLLTRVVHYPFGPIASVTFGNGRTFDRTLNRNYQPGIVQDSQSSTGGLSLGYEFDAVGNLFKLRNGNQNDPPLRQYEYDGLNRLAVAKDGASLAALQGYTYDKTGNRTSFTDGTAPPTTYSYPATSHRLSQVGAVARTYDATGSLASIGGTARQFGYGDAGRMSWSAVNGVINQYYRYNAKGELVWRYLGTADTFTVYDEGGHCLGDYDQNGAPIEQVIWLGDLPVGVLKGSGASQTLYYIEADALGTPRTVIDPVRNVAVWKWELTGEAFGNSAPTQDPDADGVQFVFNMRFPGQRYDAATGLNYNYFRDYEPSTGRYVESDPIGLSGGIGTFGYALQSPTQFADRFGLLVYTVNSAVTGSLSNGQRTALYPGGPISGPATSALNGRTALDWTITARCVCVDGKYHLDEFIVNITPVVYMRESYPRSGPTEAWVSAREGEHVNDFASWARSFEAAARAAENSAKQGVFNSQQECQEQSPVYLRTQMMQGAQGAANASSATYDQSGLHSWSGP